MEHCIKKSYFDYKAQKQIVLSDIEGIVDDDAKTITLFFPFPFLLIGMSDIELWEETPPFNEIPMNLGSTMFPIAAQNTQQPWIQKMFSVMMYANRDADDYTTAPISPFLGAISYTEKAWAKEKNYFRNHLPKGDVEAKSYLYNLFLYSQSIIKKFWADEVTRANPAGTQQRLLELYNRLYTETDTRLWGAPGLYTMKYNDPEILIPEVTFPYETLVTNVND